MQSPSTSRGFYRVGAEVLQGTVGEDNRSRPCIRLSSRLNYVLSVPMLKIFEKDGYSFFFYSNDHRPIHVHVRYAGGEAVFNVESGVELRESQDLKVRELARAEKFASEHRTLIIQKWHEHLS